MTKNKNDKKITISVKNGSMSLGLNDDKKDDKTIMDAIFADIKEMKKNQQLSDVYDLTVKIYTTNGENIQFHKCTKPMIKDETLLFHYLGDDNEKVEAIFFVKNIIGVTAE